MVSRFSPVQTEGAACDSLNRPPSPRVCGAQDGSGGSEGSGPHLATGGHQRTPRDGQTRLYGQMCQGWRLVPIT